MQFDDRLSFERAMFVYAHPDDADISSGGTVAAWTRAGVEMTYVVATNGSSGSQDPHMTREQLAQTRWDEQQVAAKILGVARVIGLGYEDGYLEPALDVRRAVAREIRRHRPDVVITLDPTARYVDGRYVNHPDHIAIGEVVLRSINPDASTRQMFPELWQEEGLEPHKPKALFLVAGLGGGEDETVVDISDTFEAKLAAIRAHASQLDAMPPLEMLERWGEQIGARKGVRLGESFKMLRLDEFA